METIEKKVVLVDKNDAELGVAEKLAAHRQGLLHRAFSVFVFNGDNQWLLQKRHHAKYHSGGLWTNTCCSHPAPGETLEAAVENRLMEEMGITASVREVFSFVYRKEFENRLIEHELDHVFIAQWGGAPTPNPAEVEDWRWLDTEALLEWISGAPEEFTHWFKLCYERVWQHQRAAELHQMIGG